MGSRSAPQTSTSVTKNEIPEWMSDAGEQLYSETTAATANPNRFVYTGPRVADLNQGHRDAASIIQGNVGSTRPAYDGALNILGGINTDRDRIQASTGAQRTYDPETGRYTWQYNPFSRESLSTFMNPFDQEVTQRAAQDLMEQRSLAGHSIADNAVASGAFGGARHAMREHLFDKATAGSLGDLYASGRQRSWDQAVNQYNTERNALFQQVSDNDRYKSNENSEAMRLAGQLGSTADARAMGAFRDAEAVRAMGDMDRAAEQAKIDAQMAQFREGSQADLETLKLRSSMLNGIPYSSTSTSSNTQMVQQPSTAGQIASGAMTGLGLILSDPKSKKNRKRADDEKVLSAFRDVPVDTYEYKGALGGDGKRVGPMADDWKGAFGGDGKTIDVGNAIGALTAAVRALDARTA